MYLFYSFLFIIYLSIFINISIFLSIYRYTYYLLTIYRFSHLSIYPSIYPSIHLFIYPFINLPIYLFLTKLNECITAWRPERSGCRPIYQVSTFNLLLYIYYSCKLLQSASIHIQIHRIHYTRSILHRYTLYPFYFT